MQFEAEKILSLSPLSVVVSDSANRIVWCNPRFLQETGLDESKVLQQLFLSLPLEAIDNHAHRVQLFTEETQSTKQFHYWPIALDSDTAFTLHYYTPVRNVTTPKPRKIKVPKRPSWVEFLDYEVSRSRRYDNPLCLLKLHLLIHQQPDSVTDEIISQTIKDTLMNELRWADMIGSTNKDSFLMVLPETPNSALNLLIKKISCSLDSQLQQLANEFSFEVVFGSTYWQKHDDSQKMLQRARQNLVVALEKTLKKSKT